MEHRGINELREMFLRFFADKGHYRMESFPLVPQDDKSLLLVNSGMAPLKKYFLGQAKVPGNRATTCQKCIRTPDIERVGKTSRHGTFFEMLGNFSFGDYFKEEAIGWAWEFMTDVVGMPREKLFCSVFEEDDEAWDIWVNKIGVPVEHMVRLGREDNFWEIGSGPCGPCSEIYYDRGEKYGCGKPDCAPGCDCDRYVEIWNLVFTQFISDGNGHYEPMEKPNIDTGMGLERLGCMVQGVDNLFEVDTIQNIMRHIERVAGVRYKDDAQNDISLRVITDHIRSTVFLVGDGVAPSNEGRGYVLRRLLRRAARHGWLLGVKRSFLYEVCETVIDENRGAYPELHERRAYIIKVIRAEEERFEKTISMGLTLMGDVLDEMQTKHQKRLSGEIAFKLNDTYGFPLDLITEMLEEKGYTVDLESYRAHMKAQRERAREDAKKKDTSWESDLFRGKNLPETEFVGYDETQSTAKLLFIAVGGAGVESASEGDKVQLVMDKTPFYAESGGQVGDIGIVTTPDAQIEIVDCQKSAEGQHVHIGVVVSGIIETGDTVTASVDVETRRAIMRNHTGAHLLQQALREVLGEHVHQSGSYVDARRLRFDFTHFEAVEPDELKKVEDRINHYILDALPVTHRILPVDEAKKEGALALFGEKYGDTVRIIDIEGCSKEFCGGTHVGNTAQLGLLKILSESSVAAGIRRIEATTGFGVLQLLDSRQAILDEIGAVFKNANPFELGLRARTAVLALRDAEHAIEEMRAKMAHSEVAHVLATGVSVGGVNVYSARIDVPANTLRATAHAIRDKDPNGVAVLAAVENGKVTLCAVCGAQAVLRGLKAGDIVKEAAALVGGSGGGKPDMAMAGGKNPEKVAEALSALPKIVENRL